MDCSKDGAARRMSWKAATVSDMEPYCTWACRWETLITWGVSVMSVMVGWGVVPLFWRARVMLCEV